MTGKHRDSDLWEAFLDVRYQLICVWAAQGRKSEEIARLLSMDPVQVAGIAAHVELQAQLVRRAEWLERELGIVRSKIAVVN